MLFEKLRHKSQQSQQKQSQSCGVGTQEINIDFSKGLVEDIETDPKPIKTTTDNEITIDFSEGFLEEPKITNNSTELIAIINEDLGNTGLVHDEEYEIAELERKAQPLIREATKHAVSEAIKFENAKMNVEVRDVLQEEVSYRLDKYEKRRSRRKFKNTIKSLVSWGILILLVVAVYQNVELRNAVIVVALDIKDMVVGLVQGDDISSNKLLEDLLKLFTSLVSKKGS